MPSGQETDWTYSIMVLRPTWATLNQEKMLKIHKTQKNQSKNKLALVKEKMQKHTELNPNQQLFVRLLICAYHHAKV